MTFGGSNRQHEDGNNSQINFEIKTTHMWVKTLKGMHKR